MEYPRASFAWLFKSYYSQRFLGILQKAFQYIFAIKAFIRDSLQISGEKDLIISPDVLHPLDLVCSYSSLKSAGVVKIYKLEDGPSPGSTNNRVYLVRSECRSTKIIANHINSNLNQNNPSIAYQIIFVPKRHTICNQILEEEGVFGYVTLFEFPLCLIPLDSDVFSAEHNNCFKDLYLNSDLSSLTYVSLLITQVKSLVGNIKRIHTLGKYAKMALKLSDYISEEKVSEEDGFITDLILVDRDVDYPAVLLSQLTYEGLLDEVYGIKCGKISIPSGVLKNDDLIGGKYIAHSTDIVYRDIRDYHLSATFARLKQKMQQLKTKQSERKEMDLTEMKGFVTNELKAIQSQHKSINIHITLSEYVLDKKKETEFAEQLEVENNILLGQDIKTCINYIEEAIIRQFSKCTALRLLSLLSLSEEGLLAKDYKHLAKLFLQSYGHEQIVSLLNLKKLGLLEQSSANTLLSPSSSSNNVLLNTKVAAAISAFPRKSHFRSSIKRLNLIPPVMDSGYNLSNPSDAGFVFGGVYIPLVCRLIETAVVNSDKNQEESLKNFPGDYNCKELNKSGTRPTKEKTVLICFIGGVTFAEISALRFLANKHGVTILVATTSIINGNILMNQIGPE